MCYDAKMNTLCGGQLVGVTFLLPPMVLGIELRSPGLHNERPSPLNHLAGLILGSESQPSFSGTAHQLLVAVKPGTAILLFSEFCSIWGILGDFGSVVDLWEPVSTGLLDPTVTSSVAL